MPTYEYRCTSCGEELEAVQKFTDAALTDCPACGGTLRKLFSNVGVVFKGSGFYKTDSRKSGGSGRKPAEKKEAAASSDPAGSEKKEPAAKPESTPAPASTPAAAPAAS